MAGSDRQEKLVAAFTRLGGIAEPTPKNSYVNITGPAKLKTPDDAALVIVQDNGSISLRHEGLAEVLSAPLRPGASSPPEQNVGHYGEARWRLGVRVLKSRFGEAPDGIARAVVAAFREAGLKW